jgi:hypothetical protein
LAFSAAQASVAPIEATTIGTASAIARSTGSSDGASESRCNQPA